MRFCHRIILSRHWMAERKNRRRMPYNQGESIRSQDNSHTFKDTSSHAHHNSLFRRIPTSPPTWSYHPWSSTAPCLLRMRSLPQLKITNQSKLEPSPSKSRERKRNEWTETDLHTAIKSSYCLLLHFFLCLRYCCNLLVWVPLKLSIAEDSRTERIAIYFDSIRSLSVFHGCVVFIVN